MNRLSPLPIYTFLKIIHKNGGISGKKLKNLIPWLIKTILLEPIRWIELAIYNKKINRHTIKTDPVFILGFYRSGTSYMHEFLTQDNRFGYHTVFQMIFPDMMLSCEKWLSPVFEFICRVFKIHDPIHRIPLSFRGPGEDDGTMTTALNPRGAQWGYFFPKKMIEYFHKYVLFNNIQSSEIEKWKRDYIFLLKKISWANQNKQLVLKSPPNTARIKLLLSIFPKAKFIFIHRNPYEVYTSNKQFLKVTQAIYAIGGSRLVDFNSNILDIYSNTMDRYLKEKDLIPKGQLIELAYKDLIEKPLACIRKVYGTLQLCDFAYCEKNMTAYAALQKEYIRLDHQLQADERARVFAKLEPYIRHWNYPIQSIKQV
jgi:hypothetical protein